VLEPEINLKNSFLGLVNSIIRIENTNIHIQMNVSEFFNKLSFLCVL